MVKTVIFTGGGSGGHVIPALTLIRSVQKNHPRIHVETIGSYRGIEAKIFQEEGLPYKAISTGKLRRYFSFQNFTDVFRLMMGFFQAYIYLLSFSRKESIVFGTGGFVIVPVVLAAKLQFKKVYLHEQTSRVGLANKIASYLADKVLVTFESSLEHFPRDKTILSGYPLREDILNPPALNSFQGFQNVSLEKPLLFVTGGGNGSLLLNNILKGCREQLEGKFTIIHQCGSRFYDELKNEQTESYKVFPFIKDEMISLLNEANVVISRAGAGTVVELMALGKPSIFVPLKIAQKNEQYHNAIEAQRKLGSFVIQEDELDIERLLESISQVQLVPKGERVKQNPTQEILSIALK